MSRVGRQESMRWAAPEANYDGGDWEEDGFDAIAEEEEETGSINSTEHHMGLGQDRDQSQSQSQSLEHRYSHSQGRSQSPDHNQEPVQDYRDIYEFYEDDEDAKRQSYNQQLEEEIYQRLTPGHSRTTSADSQVDPELAALYQGTDEFLNRPISVYTDGMQTKPLALHTSDTDRRLYKILNPKGEVDGEGEEEESTPQPTPVTSSIPPLPTVDGQVGIGAKSAGVSAKSAGSTGADVYPETTKPGDKGMKTKDLAKDIGDLDLDEPNKTSKFAAPTNKATPKDVAPTTGTTAPFGSVYDDSEPTETAPPAPASSLPQVTDLQKELQAVQSELDAAPAKAGNAPSNTNHAQIASSPPPPEPQEKAPSPDITPIHSPTLASVAITPSDLPADYDYNASPTPSRQVSDASRSSFVAKPGTGSTSASASAAPAPALALTCATPEGSDNEDDAREKPDWQPRWAPAVPRNPEPELSRDQDEQLGTDLHESQISLDMSDYSSTNSKPLSPKIKGFVDDAVSEEDSNSSSSSVHTDSDDTTTGRDSELGAAALDLSSPRSTNSRDESLRSTVGSLENDHEEPPVPAEPADSETGDAEVASKSKSISSKITRPPVVDLKAVFALDTSAKRLRSLWDLRVKEAEYTTQLSTWLESTYASNDDKSLLYPNGVPPESEGHALPTSRQVGTAITNSGAKTKETFQKVGKGFNVMKKLMRS